MTKTILINIQIDGVKAVDLAEIEELLEEALAPYKRKSVNYSLTDTMGPPLPVNDADES